MKNLPEALLTFQLGAVNVKLTRECNTLVRNQKFPIEMDHIPVLMYLYFAPSESSQQQISMDLQRDKASINRTLTFLSKKEMVSVEKNQIDKRATLVGLTPSGIKIAEKMLVLLKGFDQSFFAVLSQEEQVQLLGLLNKLIL